MNLPPSPPRSCPICGGVFGSAAFHDPEAHSCLEPVHEKWSQVAVEIFRADGSRLKAEVPVTPSDSARSLAMKLTTTLREMEAGHGSNDTGGPYR